MAFVWRVGLKGLSGLHLIFSPLQLSFSTESSMKLNSCISSGWVHLIKAPPPSSLPFAMFVPILAFKKNQPHPCPNCRKWASFTNGFMSADIKPFRTASHLVFSVPSTWCPLFFCPLSPSPSHSLYGHCPAPMQGFWIGPIEKGWVLWPQSLGSLSPPPPLIGAQQVSFSGFRPRLLSSWPSLKASDSSKCPPGLLETLVCPSPHL